MGTAFTHTACLKILEEKETTLHILHKQSMLHDKVSQSS